MTAHPVSFERWGAGLLMVVLLAGLCTPVSAFDGKRKGFLIGFGIGPDQFRVSRTGFTSTLLEVDSSGAAQDSIAVYRAREGTNSGTAITIQFQVGYGFSERLQVYFSELEDLKYFSNYYSSGIKTQSALSSLAVDYQLGRAPQLWFLTGGIGFSSHFFNDVGYGLGAFAGVGRDLGRLTQVRLLSSYGRPYGISTPPGANRHVSTFTIALLFGLVWR